MIYGTQLNLTDQSTGQYYTYQSQQAVRKISYGTQLNLTDHSTGQYCAQ